MSISRKIYILGAVMAVLTISASLAADGDKNHQRSSKTGRLTEQKSSARAVAASQASPAPAQADQPTEEQPGSTRAQWWLTAKDENASGRTADPQAGLGSSNKVLICHCSGNSNNCRTISVSANAVPAHQGHGDALGPCPGVSPSAP